MTDTTKKPLIRFNGFTEDWEQRKFSDLAETRRGLTYTPENIRSSGIRVLRSSNIDEDTFVMSDDDVFVEDEAVNIPYLNNGDILITSANGSSRLVGKHAIINSIKEKSVVHGGFMLVASSKNPSFVNALMSAPWYATFINLYVAGGNGAIGNLNKNDLDNQCVFVPDVEEQRYIGEYFKNIDDIINLYQRKYEKLINVKKACLEKMFPKKGSKVPEIRFNGFTEDWEWRKLGEIGTTYTGLSGKTKEDFGHGQAKFITYMNVFSNPVSDPEMTEAVEVDYKQNEVEVGDVFFTTSSETPEEVGMTSVLLEKRGNTYLNSFCFGYRPTIKINSYFLAYMLRSGVAREKITLLAQGISRYNISKNKVMEINVTLPSLEEQRYIGEYFKNLDALIMSYQCEIEKLQNLKKALLEKMFVA